ncbi:DUF58 domain-containing protein [Lentibacillus saliphilus]|uniref:DUF58 domain-containing protein n=1 Tax=Lentibacillus saliphilus TaxID=2737028 RepID=UPI001C2F7212|nr:DUF58 domain-containing protein [Lentibacillus saliphilus]
MMWQKERRVTEHKLYEFIGASILLLSLLGLFMAIRGLFVVAGVLIIYLVLNVLFDRSYPKNIELANPHTTLYLFPKDEGELQFVFSNIGKFPLINGHLHMQVNQTIKPASHLKYQGRQINDIEIPLSLIGKKKTIITFKFTAEQRGAARFNNISYRFPHLFSFSDVRLSYQHFFKPEIVVFPQSTPVSGIDILKQFEPGHQPVRNSIYEDLMHTVGTRNYTSRDPFQRINWKASAKSQELQTNIYETVMDDAYVFIVNASMSSDPSSQEHIQVDDLEGRLSAATFLCQFAVEHHIPFEMMINTLKPGRPPFIHVREGEGKQHLIRAMEMLARVPKEPIVYPFISLLHHVAQNLSRPKTIVVIGDVPPEGHSVMNDLMYEHPNVLNVVFSKHGDASLKPWISDVITNAR